MRDISSDLRRRRVRLIKAIEERSAKQFRSAASALTIASDTEAAKLDIHVIRRKMFVECQARPATSLRIEHAGAPAMNVPMDRPYLVVGSNPSCDLRLDHEGVEPRHCYLQWLDGHLFCCGIGQHTNYYPRRDSQSNGRWIERQPIAIGPFQMTLIRGENPSVQTAPATANSPADIFSPPDACPLERSSRLAEEYPQLALEFIGVEQSNNVWPINRMLTMIGRGMQCKLRLNHDSLACVQACLLRTPHGCWLIDLVHDGSTRVNHHVIQIAPLDVGDVVDLGVFQVEVVSLPSNPSPPAKVRRKSAKSGKR